MKANTSVFVFLTLLASALAFAQAPIEIELLHESPLGGFSAHIHEGKLYLYQHQDHSAVIYDLSQASRVEKIQLKQKPEHGGIIKFYTINDEIYYGEHRGEAFYKLNQQESKIINSLGLMYYSEGSEVIRGVPDPSSPNSPMALVIDKTRDKSVFSKGKSKASEYFPETARSFLSTRIADGPINGETIIYNSASPRFLRISPDSEKLLTIHHPFVAKINSDIQSILKKDSAFLVKFIFGMTVLGDHIATAVSSPPSEKIGFFLLDSTVKVVKEAYVSKLTLIDEYGDGTNTIYLKDCKFYADGGTIFVILPYFQNEVSRVLKIRLWESGDER